jgi:hypothetical protein
MNARTIARIVTLLLVAAGQVAGAVDWNDAVFSKGKAALDCCCGADCSCTGGCCDHTADPIRAAAKRDGSSQTEASLAALEACRFPTAATAQANSAESLKSISSGSDLSTVPQRSSVTCAAPSLNLPRNDRPSNSSPRAPPTT